MRETASVRTQVLLTPTEHAAWTLAARDSGISLGEFVRRSVTSAEFAPTPAEWAELETLVPEVNAAIERMTATIDASLARLDARMCPEAEAEREARIIAEVEADLAANPVTLDWSRLRERAAA